MKKECNCSPNTSETCGGNKVVTPFTLSGDIKDWSPAVDQALDVVIADFQCDATSEFVPTGMAMLKFATLLEALDFHAYHTGQVTLEQSRETIKWAAELMDKKFEIEYKRLPQ